MYYTLYINYCDWGEIIPDDKCEQTIIEKYSLIKNSIKSAEINTSSVFIFKIIEKLKSQKIIDKENLVFKYDDTTVKPIWYGEKKNKLFIPELKNIFFALNS